MTRHAYPSSRGRPYNSGSLGRGESVGGDDRPFAEIRRNLNDVWRMLALHRWMFFIPFCLASSGVFVASLYYPRTYKATTSFERRNDPVMMNLPMSSGAASFKYFRNTMVRDLTSVECVGEAVEESGLIEDLEREENGQLTPSSRRRCNMLARSLTGTLSISTVSPSELLDIVRITYTGPDPDVGKTLVDQVKRTYIRRTMAWIYNFLVSQRDYFKQESLEALEELQAAKREDTQLRLDNPYINPGDPGAIALKLSQLEIEGREWRLRRREYEAELSAQRQMLAAADPRSAQTDTAGDLLSLEPLNPETLRLYQKVNEIDRKIHELRETRGMTDNHPEIVDLLESRRLFTGALQDRLGQGMAAVIPNGPLATGLPSAGASARLRGDSWDGDRVRLAVQISAQQSKVKDIDISLASNEREIAQLRRAKDELFTKQEEFALVMTQVQRARQKYNQLEGTLAQLAPAIKAIEQDRLLQFSEGQPAGSTARPVSPKGSVVVLLALLAGLAAGVAFVVMAEMLDNVFRGSTQVSRDLGLPILETIDEIVTGQDRRRLLVQRAVVTPLVVMSCLALTGLTGSMAYLSITQPWAHQQIRKIPQAAIELFLDTTETSKS